MAKCVSILALVAAAALALACAARSTKVNPDPAASRTTAAENPLLAEWRGPHGGVPAFDRMALDDLKPALEAAMARQLAEVEAIAANPAPPTFENTITALERAGRDLDRVLAYYGIWSSNLSTPEFREIQREVAPRLSAHRTRIVQNDALFRRIEAVHESAATDALRPDQQRLVWLVHNGFAKEGAGLASAAKERYAEINKRLAELYTQFGNNVLADEEGYVTYLTADRLGGLPESFVKAAAAAAAERGREGEYAVTNTRSSMDPFLTFSDERELREKVWRTYYSRGDNGGEHDNNAVIREILELRHERVKLLGYPNYATWQLEDRMAKTPERALELMQAVWPAALARVEQEVADMQAIADAEGAGIVIEPWDYRHYAEKVRRSRYELDSDEIKQYLQLDKLRQAMFFVAGELFGFEFRPVAEGSIPVFHPDVTVWEVTDRDTGEHVGLWYLDPYARAGKRSGAWATSYRGHDTLDGTRTVLASNNSNFIEGAAGEPVLVSWDDAETLFHEFGHALHSLSSKVDYPTLNGGVRDYTEFQSQLLERWLSTDEVVDTYLVHHETGEPIPDALVQRIERARTFNQGFAQTEYLASALMDMRYHSIDPTGLDPDAYERQALAELGMPDEIVMRHRSPHFTHVFSGEGYAAGYYGYLWADVLTADAAEAFGQAPGGFYDEALARKLVDNLFAVRNAVDPAEAYRAFRGRDARIDAVMRSYGFPVPGGAASSAATWPGFRGPLRTGVAPEARPPVSWSESENVAWKVAVEGGGHASPIVWGGRVLVLSAVSTDAGVESPHRFVVSAFESDTGKSLWSTVVREAVPHEGGHATGSQASGSPVTDGERIYAHFGSRGIHALDMDGRVVWSTDLGRMETRNSFGEGGSPALAGEALIVNWDHEGQSFIVALDKRSGAELWRQARDEPSSWSTPLVVSDGGRELAVVAATNAVRAYDVKTGEVVWHGGGLGGNVIPTPVADGTHVFVMSGWREARGMAIRYPGARGDLTGSERIAWSTDRGLSYVPSPVLHEGKLYFLQRFSGILSCRDLATGEPCYEQRRIEGLDNVYASLVAADGRLYAVSRDGAAVVLEAGAEPVVLATNTLDDSFSATPAIVGSTIFLRGEDALYAIRE